MKIYAYNENCVLAGHEVPADKIDRSEDPENEGDWTCYEGTPEGLLDQADSLDFTDGSPGRANTFRLRVARLIRSEVYRYHPELEPAEESDVDAVRAAGETVHNSEHIYDADTGGDWPVEIDGTIIGTWPDGTYRVYVPGHGEVSATEDQFV